MADLNESFVSGEGHYENGEFHNCGLFMFFDVDLLDGQIFLRFSFLLDLLHELYNLSSFLGVVLEVDSEFLFLLFKLLNFFFQKFSQLLFASVVLINKSSFDYIEDAIKFIGAFLVASQQFLFHIRVVRLVPFEGLPILIKSSNLYGQFLFGHEEVLILLDEPVSGMLCNALNTYIFVVGLAVKFEGLVVEDAEFVTLADLLLVAGQLEDNEIFAEHVGLNLWIVFESAGGTVQELLFFVHNKEALFADGVAAVEIPRGFLLAVVEVVTHGAFHPYFIIQLHNSVSCRICFFIKGQEKELRFFLFRVDHSKISNFIEVKGTLLFQLFVLVKQ